MMKEVSKNFSSLMAKNLFEKNNDILKENLDDILKNKV